MQRRHLRAASGSEAAPVPADRRDSFEAFFEDHHADLFGALYLITRNRHEAEEIMQDAFLKVLERWERVGSLADPVGYLLPKGHESVPQAVEEGVGHARRTVGLSPGGDEISLIETRVDVVRAVASLSPRQRAVVVLTAARPRPAGRDRSALGQGMGCEARSPWPVGVPRPPGVPPVRSDHASGGRVRIAPPR